MLLNHPCDKIIYWLIQYLQGRAISHVGTTMVHYIHQGHAFETVLAFLRDKSGRIDVRVSYRQLVKSRLYISDCCDELGPAYGIQMIFDVGRRSSLVSDVMVERNAINHHRVLMNRQLQ